MPKLTHPFQRRGWRAVRMLVVAAYLTRFGGQGGAALLRLLGKDVSYDAFHTPWYFLYPLMMVAFYLADGLLTGASLSLRRNDLPTWLAPLEMAWPVGFRIQVWQPAFRDEAALYHTQPYGASRWLKNVLFLARVTGLFILTLRILLVDRLCSKLLQLVRNFR